MGITISTLPIIPNDLILSGGNNKFSATRTLHKLLPYLTNLMRYGIIHLSSHKVARQLNLNRKTVWKWLCRLAKMGWNGLTIICKGSWSSQCATVYEFTGCQHTIGKVDKGMKISRIKQLGRSFDRGKLHYLPDLEENDNTKYTDDVVLYLKYTAENRPTQKKVTESQRAGINLIYDQWYYHIKTQRWGGDYILPEFMDTIGGIKSPEWLKDHEKVATDKLKYGEKEALCRAARELAPERPNKYRPFPDPPKNMRPPCQHCDRTTSVYVDPYQECKIEWRCSNQSCEGWYRPIPFEVVFTVIDFNTETYDRRKKYFDGWSYQKPTTAKIVPTDTDWLDIRNALSMGYSMQGILSKYDVTEDQIKQ